MTQSWSAGAESETLQQGDLKHGEHPSWGQAQRRAMRLGIAGAALGTLALIVWAALAPLAAAIIAEGTVKSMGNRKTVQHAEGGIVSIIHVKDGDRVKQGQTLITLADARVTASVQSLREQGAANALRVQRLRTEMETMDASFEPDLHALRDFMAGSDTAYIEELARREKALFVARARQQAEQAYWLNEQLTQTRREIATQQELIATTDSAMQLARRDLESNEKLRADGFVSEARLMELQRIVADYRARLQGTQAQLSQARQREADFRLKLSSQKTEFARASAEELKEITARLALTMQELGPAMDAQSRQRIVAPVAGEVVGLRVHTVGSAIGPREPALEIVPANSELVIEARIAPSDIRDVQQAWVQAKTAHVMLTAYRTRATPQIDGTLRYVGADRLTDPNAPNPNAPYYVAHIAISPQALRAASELARQTLTLSPGMQAEVFIATDERSAWRYLFDPVLDGIRRSLRER
ncbi:type I secretion membrane fusion protein, HlyD family [Variovorax sp. YR750]|uniref:HlyD family type I secretion periplasmic adaptor subunit n=1 Tax=Variovorax sp. YR750 TaxID=1884384 RepID=UPI0008B5EE82|nr:HlyD family type I secretion periplasmic adaptor subunit [Variovorax sp. YR750]SEK36647.1 type I secretion membrane fusion protein, HlyD family [Variovorax sp. YR750]